MKVVLDKGTNDSTHSYYLLININNTQHCTYSIKYTCSCTHQNVIDK